MFPAWLHCVLRGLYIRRRTKWSGPAVVVGYLIHCKSAMNVPVKPQRAVWFLGFRWVQRIFGSSVEKVAEMLLTASS
jgi:hypothetical protein